MDPNRATREEFTNHITSLPLPDFAAPGWKAFAINHRNLVTKLAHDPAMAPNLQQTYMTPANSKNKVYFMWDFVGRTLGMLYQVNPTLDGMSADEKERWSDVQGRATYAAMLILDKVPGMLDGMVEAAYGHQAGKHPAFGEEVLTVARQIESMLGEEMMEMLLTPEPEPEELSMRIQYVYSAMEKQLSERGLSANGARQAENGPGRDESEEDEWEDVDD